MWDRDTEEPSAPATRRSFKAIREDLALDEEACATLGRALSELRVQRSLSHADVARRLILSVNQVRGLECADVTPFYNAAYFVSALDKYLQLMGTSVDVGADSLLRYPAKPMSGNGQSDTPWLGRTLSELRRYARRSVRPALMVIVALLLAGVTLDWQTHIIRTIGVVFGERAGRP